MGFVLHSTTRIGYPIFDLARSIDSLYIAAGQLYIVDAIAATPTLRGCWHDTGATSVEVIGGFAYLFNTSAGEIVPIDIWESEPPVLAGTWITISQYALLMVPSG